MGPERLLCRVGIRGQNLESDDLLHDVIRALRRELDRFCRPFGMARDRVLVAAIRPVPHIRQVHGTFDGCGAPRAAVLELAAVHDSGRVVLLGLSLGSLRLEMGLPSSGPLIGPFLQRWPYCYPRRVDQGRPSPRLGRGRGDVHNHFPAPSVQLVQLQPRVRLQEPLRARDARGTVDGGTACTLFLREGVPPIGCPPCLSSQ
mmetsp:Transcript_96285/g.272177  ORF Transcript_96285/g.272177 Transcript_96285/m.272177 type:complete len:202 (-) Transcript_96285:52-657(-)